MRASLWGRQFDLAAIAISGFWSIRSSQAFGSKRCPIFNVSHPTTDRMMTSPAAFCVCDAMFE